MKEIAKELQVIKLNGKLKKGRANSNNGLKKRQQEQRTPMHRGRQPTPSWKGRWRKI